MESANNYVNAGNARYIGQDMASDADKHSRRTRHGQWMNPTSQTGLASIIIPTFNRAVLLNDALASAAAQTYRPLEIIVVDDGSTDNTPQVIKHWQDQLQSDPKISIRYFPQPNSGVGSARNRGLIESRGEFIQFLDSDDLLHPQKLSLHIACLQQYPECGYVFSDWIIANDLNKWAEICVNSANIMDSAQFYCRREVMLTMLGLYRRQTCCQAGPYAEDMSLGEDEEFNLRVLLATAKLVYLPGVLCALRNHSGPRLTDGLKGQNRMIHFVSMYGRMIESATAAGRLNDARLVSSLVKCLTDTIIEALKGSCRDIADDSIKLCRMLPIKPARRRKLAVYQFFNSLPPGTFPRLWPFWLKFRHTVFEIPTRKIARLRNGWKIEKQSA